MPLINEDYYTAFEFADLQNVHVKTVYRWVKQGIAPENEMFGRMLWFEKKAANVWEKPAWGARNTRKGLTAGKTAS